MRKEKRWMQETFPSKESTTSKKEKTISFKGKEVHKKISSCYDPGGWPSLAPRGFGAMVCTIWYQSLHPDSSLRAGGNAGIAVFVWGSYGQGRAHHMGAHPAQSLDCGAWWDVMILVGGLHQHLGVLVQWFVSAIYRF